MLTRMFFWGALLAGLAVVLGAFGAHVLQPYLVQVEVGPERTPPMEVFKTGVQYHFYHALALILCGLLYKQKNASNIKNAAFLFLIGIVLFSGTLYTITLGYVLRRDLNFLGAITPLGGLAFMIGWGLLAYVFGQKGHSRS